MGVRDPRCSSHQVERGRTEPSQAERSGVGQRRALSSDRSRVGRLDAIAGPLRISRCPPNRRQPVRSQRRLHSDGAGLVLNPEAVQMMPAKEAKLAELGGAAGLRERIEVAHGGDPEPSDEAR